VGDAPPLEIFQARLDGALSTLIQLKMSLLTAGGVDWMAFKGPSQPNPFYDAGEVTEAPEAHIQHMVDFL